MAKITFDGWFGESWEPWNVFKRELEALPIEGPPCHNCNKWGPKRAYNNGEYEGVKLCHSPNMEHDFSCYRKPFKK